MRRPWRKRRGTRWSWVSLSFGRGGARPAASGVAARTLFAGVRTLAERSDLDRAACGRRAARRPFDRVVEVRRVDQVVASELLLGLGERPVGGDRPAVPDPD